MVERSAPSIVWQAASAATNSARLPSLAYATTRFKVLTTGLMAAVAGPAACDSTRHRALSMAVASSVARFLRPSSWALVLAPPSSYNS